MKPFALAHEKERQRTVAKMVVARIVALFGFGVSLLPVPPEKQVVIFVGVAHLRKVALPRGKLKNSFR